MSKKSKLNRLYESVGRAQKKLLAELERAYPIGMDINFIIANDQLHHSKGIVVAHWDDGVLRVKHHTEKGHVTSISYEQVWEKEEG